MRLFASDRVARLISFFKLEEGVPIAEHRIVARSIETAQRRVESHNFEIRKHVLEYDNVMNKQREVIYSERKTVLFSDDLKEHIFNMTEDVLSAALDVFAPSNLHPEEWEYKGLIGWLKSKFLVKVTEDELNKVSREEFSDYLYDKIKDAYSEKEKTMSAEMTRQIERFILLQTIDSKWKDHLLSMDYLREGIHLRGYGQRDPLVEYQREGYDMFMAMADSIKEEALEYIFKIQAVETDKRRGVFTSTQQEFIHQEAESMSDIIAKAPAVSQTRMDFDNQPMPSPDTGPVQPYKRKTPRVGRNDPCPCGSGKKYKKCCGS
jgi:preprotein translocase subunit SecA